MLRLIDASGVTHPITDYTDFRIRHIQSGADALSFCFPTNHEQYPLLQNECIIQTEGNEWTIKKIDEDRFDCELNFDFLRTREYLNYTSSRRTISQVLADHLPTGWTVEGAASITKQRSIGFEYCTDYDIVMECIDTYDVVFIWHIREKRVEVIDLSAIPVTGEYLTTELNLRKIKYKGQTSNFATRLYAYGADGMTLETAVIGEAPNGDAIFYGKPYVEDYTYSDKLVIAIWKDERYTVPENLYEAALKRIHAMAAPVVSYNCDVVDLAKKDPRYAFLSFALHKKVTLIDADRGTRLVHQIVEYNEWPDEPDRNTVKLASVAPTIQTRIKTEVNQLKNADQVLVSKIIKTNEGIALEVENRKSAVEALSARLDVHDDEIAARVTQTGGTNASFGWSLTVDGHSWYAGNKKVASITASGAEVVGKITATSGEIGGCKIENGVLKVGNANIDEINASKITAGILSVDRLEAGSIVTDKIASGAITNDKIGGYAVTGGKIATDAIVNRHITSGSIYNSTLSGGCVSDAKLDSELQDAIAEAIYAKNVFAGNTIATHVGCTYLHYQGQLAVWKYANGMWIMSHN